MKHCFDFTDTAYLNCGGYNSSQSWAKGSPLAYVVFNGMHADWLSFVSARVGR